MALSRNKEGGGAWLVALLWGLTSAPDPRGVCKRTRKPRLPLNSPVTTQPVTAQSSPEPSGIAVPWVDLLSFPWALLSLLKWGQ